MFYSRQWFSNAYGMFYDSIIDLLAGSLHYDVFELLLEICKTSTIFDSVGCHLLLFFFLNDVPPRTTSRIFFVRSYSNIFIYKLYVVNYRRCIQIYGWHKLQVWLFVWIVQDNQILNFVRMVTHTPHHNPNRIKIWTAIPFLPQKPKQNNKRVITIKMAGKGHRVITCKEFIGKYTT